MYNQHASSASSSPAPSTPAHAATTPPVATSHSSSSSALSRFSSWMSGCFSSRSQSLSKSSSPSLFERVKAAATTSRFERDLLKQADSLIEVFFSDKQVKPDKAQEFDKVCQAHLARCLENFHNRVDLKKTEKSTASVLKVVHKLVVDFHMRRIKHPKRLTLLCWEWDSNLDRYKTGGDKSRWEIEVCRGVGHVKEYCAKKFEFPPQDIHIIYQGRHLTDDERFRDVCVQKGSFINMIFLRGEDTLQSVNLDVAEMEHGTPQECIEKSDTWMRILRQMLNDKLVGKKVSTLTWEVMRALPRRSCYQHVLMDFSDRNEIFDGEIKLPKELAGLIGEFVPSTIQDIYLERSNGDPAGVDVSNPSTAPTDTDTHMRTDLTDNVRVTEAPAPTTLPTSQDSDSDMSEEAGAAVDPTSAEQEPAPAQAPASPPITPPGTQITSSS